MNEETIEAAVKEVQLTRAKVIDDFVKAWLAVEAPANFDAAWVISNIEIVERRLLDGSIAWSIQKKPSILEVVP